MVHTVNATFFVKVLKRSNFKIFLLEILRNGKVKVCFVTIIKSPFYFGSWLFLFRNLFKVTSQNNHNFFYLDSIFLFKSLKPTKSY